MSKDQDTRPFTKSEWDKSAPKLAVWYGSMPESNGKSNWTAILHNGDICEGFTIDRSEYPDRVRYEADRVRFLIGELNEAPFILDYDADKCDAAALSESSDNTAAELAIARTQFPELSTMTAAGAIGWLAVELAVSRSAPTSTDKYGHMDGADFMALCDALPEGAHWGDPITPEIVRTLIAAAPSRADDVPAGAIENGRVFADRLEAYAFECEAGPLRNCTDWQEFRRCFEHLAQWAETQSATLTNEGGSEPVAKVWRMRYPADVTALQRIGLPMWLTDETRMREFVECGATATLYCAAPQPVECNYRGGCACAEGACEVRNEGGKGEGVAIHQEQNPMGMWQDITKTLYDARIAGDYRGGPVRIVYTTPPSAAPVAQGMTECAILAAAMESGCPGYENELIAFARAIEAIILAQAAPSAKCEHEYGAVSGKCIDCGDLATPQFLAAHQNAQAAQSASAQEASVKGAWCSECSAFQCECAAPAPSASPAALTDDLAALVRQLAHSLRKASPDHPLAARAMDYLKRTDLQGSPLRAASPASQDAQPSAKALTDEQIEAIWDSTPTAETGEEMRRRFARALLAAEQPSEPKCKACAGNNGDVPCAYPDGSQPACLRAQPSEDKRDAERYRWLRDDEEWVPFCSQWLVRSNLYGEDGPELDAFIDAAIAKGDDHG